MSSKLEVENKEEIVAHSSVFVRSKDDLFFSQKFSTGHETNACWIF